MNALEPDLLSFKVFPILPQWRKALKPDGYFDQMKQNYTAEHVIFVSGRKYVNKNICRCLHAKGSVSA